MSGHDSTLRLSAPDEASWIDPGVLGRLHRIVVVPASGAWSAMPGHRLPPGALLYGPESSGQRALVAWVASQLDVPLVTVDLTTALRPSVIAMLAATRRAIFERNCVLLLDGLDAVAAHSELRRHLGVYLDGLQTIDVEHRPLVMTTSDRPWALDPDWIGLGRLDRLVHVPPPQWDGRIARLTALGERCGLHLGDSVQVLAAATAGWSGADLDAVVAELVERITSGSMPLVAPAVASVVADYAEHRVDWRHQIAPWGAAVARRGRTDDLVGWLSAHG